MSALQISSPRLRLEPFGTQHLSEKYVAWLNDPELMRFSEQRHTTHSLETCRTYASGFDHRYSYLWAILLSDQNVHVGNINAYINPIHNFCDIGILIGDGNTHGQGIGLEAWRAVMHAMFSNKKCRKITGGCLADNAAMVKIMERSGMISDGQRRRHYVYDGNEFDIVYMAAFEPDQSIGNDIAVMSVPLPNWKAGNG